MSKIKKLLIGENKTLTKVNIEKPEYYLENLLFKKNHTFRLIFKNKYWDEINIEKDNKYSGGMRDNSIFFM